MLTQFLIKHISQEDWVEVLQSGGNSYNIPKNWLPSGAIEGDEVFILPFSSRTSPENGKQLNIILAPRKVFQANAKVTVYKSNHALNDAA